MISPFARLTGVEADVPMQTVRLRFYSRLVEKFRRAGALTA
jgi:hypothetical protein